MANAKLLESILAQCVFAALDDAEGFGSNGAPILHARRETGGGGLVPNPQVGLTREFPDFRLGQSSFEQRRQNVMLSRGLLPGPKITLIVGIYPVGNSLKSAAVPIAFEDGEQFVFAMETTHCVVADI